jgi:DNA-binding MarR family transcriptional regulator
MTAKKREATGEELNLLFHEVCDLHDALTAAMDKVQERLGLRSSQYRVAHALEHMGQATVPEVAASLGVTRQFVQVVCNGLKAADLAEFRDSPRHRRSKLVTLTEKGKRMVERSRRAQAALIEKTLPGVSYAQVSDATVLLYEIGRNMRTKGPLRWG